MKKANQRRRVVSTYLLMALTLAWWSCKSTSVGSIGATTMPRSKLLTQTPSDLASAAFRGRWFDGNAELSGYQVTQPRYGELRSGHLVLTYVTEPMNKTTRIKDDDAAKDNRVDVIKLNANLSFLTGIYPYSVMTSVFSPIDRWQGEDALSPIKITTTVQEWCGHTFHGMWPGDTEIGEHLMSYFASEGEGNRLIPRPSKTLFEDALLIQLRELDGAFAGGGNWEGYVVPALWRMRRAHVPVVPLAASITRRSVRKKDTDVTEFTLVIGAYTRAIDVEAGGDHRILGWTTSDGETAQLLSTAKLPYWQLNHTGDESRRQDLGLKPETSTFPLIPPTLPGSVGN